MYESVKLRTKCGNIICGLADFERFSADRIVSLSGVWENPAGTLCKAGSSTVAFTVDDLFVKCSPARNFKRALSRCFRISRAMRNLKMSAVLLEMGIPTPRVLCAVREKRHFLPVCDFLVTEKLSADAVTFGNACAPTQREEFFFLGCALLKKMHDARICHGDASVRNFYIGKENGSAVLGVIDLDACRIVPPFAGKRVFVKEDARFISSFIITTGAQETFDAVNDICLRFLQLHGTSADTAEEYLQNLLKYTFIYLKKTRRYSK